MYSTDVCVTLPTLYTSLWNKEVDHYFIQVAVLPTHEHDTGHILITYPSTFKNGSCSILALHSVQYLTDRPVRCP
jgi:hypothetical protein